MEGDGATAEDAKVEGDPSADSQQRKRSKTSEDSLLRWKRRRQLKNVLDKAGDFPSFVALISGPDGNGAATDDNDEKDLMPESIVIDVDEYLGLKKKELRKTDTTGSIQQPQAANASFQALAGRRSTPAEEGYYEGRVLLASPDDEQYLSSIQQLIRNNLEYFSATALDAAGSQAGRRQPIVEGKVGVRCIHCTKYFMEKLNSNTIASTKEDAAKIWPPGSISYPTNIAGLYGVCSGKPQQHFDSCPNTPLAVKSHFHRHANDKGGGQSKSKDVPAALYYVVAAKRLGLIDVPGGGIRFGRDLKLEPLPLEAVLAEERQETEEFKALPPPAFSPQGGMSSPDMVGSYNATSVDVDATAEEVLAEAVAQKEEPETNPSRASDRNMVSDFVFITIRQLAICRAVPADFATRGKKTKSMRLGFAGFCCRHCLRVREAVDGSELARANGASDFSCRSFSSAADNLGPAVTNTFALHLMKCQNVPVKIRKALETYKKHHARQMSELPYGSQRKLFSEIWTRLREADVDEAEMKDRIQRFLSGDAQAATFPLRASSSTTKPRSPRTSSPHSSSSPKTYATGSGRRTFEIPGSKDPETAKVLARFEQDWNPSVNDGLILPADRDITSDYLFLTVRQLKVTLPTAADVAKCKRGSGIGAIAGMCCMHCDRKDPSLIAPSSRSFATAPDNYASAFNTSLYNHMQSCIFVKPDVKKALADLRKIHSEQIQALEKGSQRRFFTLLFNRLKSVPVGKPIPGKPIIEKPRKVASRSSRGSNSGGATPDRGSRATRSSESADDALLSRFGFFEAPCQSFFCLRCRMVPLQFRARGSLCFARPTIDFLTEHSEACKEDGFDLWFVNESLKKLFRTDFNVKHLTDPLFKEVIMECFGRDEQLSNVFTNEIVKVFQMSRHGGVSRAIEMAVKAKTQGLWFRLPQTVDTSKVKDAYAKFAASVQGVPPQLADNSALATYLLLISPSLSLGEEEADVEEDDSGESKGGEATSEAAAKTPSEAEGSEFEDEEEDKKPIAAQRGKRGKELRRKDNDGDDDDDDYMEPSAESNKVEDGGGATVTGGNGDSVQNVVVAPKPRGKELRK